MALKTMLIRSCRRSCSLHVLLVILRVSAYSNVGNNLTSVPADIPLAEFEVYLNNNRITLIDSFPSLTSLLTLNLNHNGLISFPDLRNVAGTLETLHLKSNQITLIDTALLDALTSLVKLELNDNRLVTLPDVSGLGGSLLTLDLSHNLFQEMPVLLKIGPSLTNLQIGNNLLTNSDFTGKIFSTGLQSLNVESNSLGRVPILRDDVKTGLKNMNLHQTALKALGAGELNGYNSLTTLDIGGNNFTRFPDLSAVGTTLSNLFLQSNVGQLIATGGNLKSLTALNTLQLLDTAWKELPNFCHLKLPGSPFIDMRISTQHIWNCDCHAKWIKMLQLRFVFVFINFGQLCNSPEYNHNSDWNSLNPSDLTCQERDRSFYITPIDIDNFYCASAPISEEMPVKSRIECAVLCARSTCCVYFNVVTHDDAGVLCSLTDLCHTDLTKANNFSNTGVWYSLD